MRFWRIFLALVTLVVPLVLVWTMLGKGGEVDVEAKMDARLMGPLSYDDPDLLHLVTSHFLHQPSTRPYNLVLHTLPTRKDAQLYYGFQTEYAHAFYASIINTLFKDVKGGVFVEAGALDGEFLSNTLRLEQEAAWTGLLVEPNRDMFDRLIQKQRRVWASNCCLATHSYPHREILINYKRSANHKDALLDGFADAHSVLAGLTDGAPLDGSSGGYRSYESVQCLPLATLLLALNITRVDLVSLDVEGAEVGVLRHFPWGRVTVDVWMVEHVIPTLSTPSTHSSYTQHTITPPTQILPPQSEQNHQIHQDTQKGKTVIKPNDFNAESFYDSSYDQQFIDVFTSRGYELYTLRNEYGIGNYVFILIDSELYKNVVI